MKIKLSNSNEWFEVSEIDYIFLSKGKWYLHYKKYVTGYIPRYGPTTAASAIVKMMGYRRSMGYKDGNSLNLRRENILTVGGYNDEA